MNCDQFSRQWNAHVGGMLQQREESQMLDHSRGCDPCGTRWREHDELCVMLGNVLQPLKQPENMTARLVERLPAPAIHPDRTTPARDDTHQSPFMQSGPLLLAAFLGGAVMYLMSGGGSHGNVFEQMALMESVGRFSPLRGATTMSLVIMQSRELLSLLFTLCFLVWITRASFWEVLFPYRMPLGVAVARWLAVPTLVIGGLRLLVALLILARSWSIMATGQNNPDFGILLTTANVLNQVWLLGFWLTLLVLLFGMLNEISLRHARPLQ